MRKSNSNLVKYILSIAFLIGTISTFFWLWNSAQPGVVSDSVVDQKYKQIEIASIKKTAEDLIKDKENLGNLPIKAPTEDQIGRTNPFAGL